MTTKKTLRTTLFLHADLSKQAKVQAIVEGLTLTSLVEKALISYLPKETVVKKTKITIR